MVVRRILAASALLVVLTAGTAGTAAAQDPASPAASVLPNTLERAPVEVKGATALPRTGGDIDVELFAGAGLTAAGLAFALTARQRRRRFESAPTFS